MSYCVCVSASVCVWGVSPHCSPTFQNEGQEVRHKHPALSLSLSFSHTHNVYTDDLIARQPITGAPVRCMMTAGCPAMWRPLLLVSDYIRHKRVSQPRVSGLISNKWKSHSNRLFMVKGHYAFENFKISLACLQAWASVSNNNLIMTIIENECCNCGI